MLSLVFALLLPISEGSNSFSICEGVLSRNKNAVACPQVLVAVQQVAAFSEEVVLFAFGHFSRPVAERDEQKACFVKNVVSVVERRDDIVFRSSCLPREKWANICHCSRSSYTSTHIIKYFSYIITSDVRNNLESHEAPYCRGISIVCACDPSKDRYTPTTPDPLKVAIRHNLKVQPRTLLLAHDFVGFSRSLRRPDSGNISKLCLSDCFFSGISRKLCVIGCISSGFQGKPDQHDTHAGKDQRRERPHAHFNLRRQIQTARGAEFFRGLAIVFVGYAISGWGGWRSTGQGSRAEKAVGAAAFILGAFIAVSGACFAAGAGALAWWDRIYNWW